MNKVELKNYVTWERLAVSLVTILIVVIGFVGRGVVVNVEAMRMTMSNLNDTLSDFKVQMAVNTQNHATTNRRIDELRDWTGLLAGRLHEVELNTRHLKQGK